MHQKHTPFHALVIHQDDVLTPSFTGGKKILQRFAGKDASKPFWKYHNESILKKYSPKLLVGSLDSKPKPKEEPKPEPAPVTVKEPSPKVVKAAEQEASSSEESEPLEPFGHQIPFADPSWYQSVSYPCTFTCDLFTDVFDYSTTHPTSTRHMLPSELRFANGSTVRLSPMSPSGMKPSACPRRSTRRWAAEATSLVCSV